MDMKNISQNLPLENVRAYLTQEIGILGEETLDHYLTVIEELLKAKEHEKAQKVLEMVAERFPTNGRVLYNYGILYMHRQKLEKAKDYMEQAVEAGYATYKSLTVLSIVHKRLGNQKEVLDALQKAAHLQEDELIPKLLVFYELFEQFRYEQALNYAQQLQQQFPGYYELEQAELTVLDAMKADARMSMKLDQLEETYANEPLYIYDRAKFMIGRKEYEQALEYLQANQALLDEKSAQYLGLCAAIYAKLEKKEESKLVLQQLHQLHRLDEAGVSLATLLMTEKSYAQAMEILQEVKARRIPGKGYYTALLLLATCAKMCKLDQEQIDQAYRFALASYSHAYKQGELRVLVVGLSAECYRELGQVENEKLCRQYIEKVQKMYDDAK